MYLALFDPMMNDSWQQSWCKTSCLVECLVGKKSSDRISRNEYGRTFPTRLRAQNGHDSRIRVIHRPFANNSPKIRSVKTNPSIRWTVSVRRETNRNCWLPLTIWISLTEDSDDNTFHDRNIRKWIENEKEKRHPHINYVCEKEESKQNLLLFASRAL